MPAMPQTVDEQAEFLLRTVIPFLKNDLLAVVESRCEVHGGEGGAPNFTTVLLSFAAIEVVAQLDSSSPGKAGRREQFGRLAAVAQDPRYAELGELAFVVFRHGIAHTFLPKLSPDVGGAAMWALSARGGNRCIEDVRGDLLSLRAEWHLQLRQQGLFLMAQVLCIDVLALLEDWGARLRSRDVATMARLGALFGRFWNDNASIQPYHLDSSEWVMLQNGRGTLALLVETYPAVEVAGTTLTRSLFREHNEWRLEFDRGRGPEVERFDTRVEADDRASELQADVYR